jgi:hypothetical protein
MVTTLQRALAIVEALPVDRSCHGCNRFTVDTGRCSQWQDVVPIEARADGCDVWLEQVPF